MNDGQNRVGLIVDPERDELPFSFTVEVFEAGTVTEMAVNPGFELFYVLQGKGTAFCEGEKMNVPFGVGDSLLFPPKLTHGVSAGADESVVVLGLMLHAPGVGVSPHAFVQWATGGDAVGPLCPAELASLYTSATAATTAATAAKNTPPPTAATTATTAAPTAAPLTAASSDASTTVTTSPTLPRWPSRRGIHELVPMHLAGASGLAAAPTNRLLLVYDSHTVPFVFALEVFNPGHLTPHHIHPDGHELFYILSGEGEAFCDGERWPVRAGNTCVFPVGSLHGIDVSSSSPMMTLELMVPSEPERLAVRCDGDAVPAWDTTCMPDGTTGRMACSELGFTEAIRRGSPAPALTTTDVCGFAPHRC